MTRHFSRRALVDLAQAAYATGSSDAAWLEDLHARANALLDTGMGSIGYFVDGGAKRITGVVGDDFLAQSVIPMHEAQGETAYDVYFEPRATSLARFYRGKQKPHITSFLGRSAGDIWGITCVDALGRGIVLTAPQGTRRTLPLGIRAWTMAAVHIATAWRLRARGAAPAEAVLSKDGRLLHREPNVAGSEKEIAAAVVRRAEALEGASTTGSEAALAAWRSLTSGRWSIVEDVESDGKRYLVARANELETDKVAGVALTALERQVCAMAAAAHSQKLIAYELGIHPSAVARQLASGMSKLRVSSTAVLARRFSWLPAAARSARQK